jgi:hypothetical protein
MPEQEDAQGATGPPGRDPIPSLRQRLQPWWRRGRWLFEVAELVAAAKDATALAVAARAVVLIGDTVWPENR